MKPDLETEIVQLLQRYPELSSTFEARRTLSWLEAKIVAAGPTLDGDWNQVCSRMHQANSRNLIFRAIPIENDFWICKRANPAAKPPDFHEIWNQNRSPWSIQLWQPPADWRQWPIFDVGSEEWLTQLESIQTNCVSFEPQIGLTSEASPDRARAMQIMRELDSTALAAASLCNQSVGWLDTALGRIGRLWSAATLSEADPELLLQELVFSVSLKPSIYADMMEGTLQAIYGSAIGPERKSLVVQYTSGGQSFEWRDYFRALSQSLSTEHSLMAVQLAALALRSESSWALLELLRGAKESYEGLLDLSVCIRRRWLLAAKALAWIEISLCREKPFELITPGDVMCFGIDSLLPIYPRPLLAVSHRSADIKLELIKSKAWGSNEVTIDATFRPFWQTNRAMVWSLFASTPVLCRVRSKTYEESSWCKLESEMFEHLIEIGDFVDGRRLIEIESSSLAVLDHAARSSFLTHRAMDIATGIDSPAMEIHRFVKWQGALIRAVAIARFINRAMAVSELPKDYLPREAANMLLENLLADDGEGIPNDELMGIENGWHVLSRALRTDVALLDLKGPLARPAVEVTNREAQAWFNSVGEIWPNFGSGANLADLLAAVDWRENLEHHLRGGMEGSIFEFQPGFIDLRRTNETEWATDPGWSVARGLIHLRLPYPLIIRQVAGQDAENWQFLKEVDLPIFTEHFAGQRLPQSEVFFSLGGPWPAVYYNSVKDYVEVSPYLVFACSVSSKSGPDPVMVRADGGFAALSLPGSPSLEEWLRDRGPTAS